MEAGQWEDFQAFVGRVRERLDVTGCTLPVAKALSEAEEALAAAKRKYLRKRILCDIARDLVSDDPGIARPRNQRLDKICDTAGRLFLAACAQDMTQLAPGSNTRLYGLEEEQLSLDCDEETRHVVSEALNSIISDHLRHRVCHVTRMHSTATPRDSEQLLVAKSRQLPAVLREEMQEISAAETPTRQLLLQHIDTLKQLLQAQVEHLKSLEQIVIKYRIGLHDGDFTFAAGQTARAKWLIVRSRKARYALRLCMQQILDSTYTERSIPELQRVRDRLQETYSRAVQQHQTLSSTLQEYEALPAEFRDIAREYHEVQQDIAALTAVDPRARSTQA